MVVYISLGNLTTLEGSVGGPRVCKRFWDYLTGIQFHIDKTCTSAHFTEHHSVGSFTREMTPSFSILRGSLTLGR